MLRVLNHKSGLQEETWKDIHISLIQKVLRPKIIKQFRPIPVLPVLSRLCSNVFDWSLLGTGVSIFQAWRPIHEVSILRRIIELVIECKSDGDISEDYDYIQHDREKRW